MCKYEWGWSDQHHQCLSGTFLQLKDGMEIYIFLFIHSFILQIIAYWSALDRRNLEKLNIKNSFDTYQFSQQMSSEHFSLHIGCANLWGEDKELKLIFQGHLAGSFCRACNSWSQSPEFEPHVGNRVDLKKRKRKKVYLPIAWKLDNDEKTRKFQNTKSG